MGRPAKNIPKGTYNYLTVIEYKNAKNVICECKCGIVKSYHASKILTGHTKSCGCFSKETSIKRLTTHNLSKSKIYTMYFDMIKRCYDKENNRYKDYGGRGIKVCDNWLIREGDIGLKSFFEFVINNGWVNGLTIDRIKNNDNYSPENCKLSTRKQQMRNRRNTIIVTAFGETKSLADWSEDQRCCVSYKTLYARFKNGTIIEEAITSKNKRKKDE